MKVFDIEAYSWNRIYAIGIYDGNKPITLVDTAGSNDTYIEWLLDKLADGDIVYAHNGGKYDFLFIFDYLRKNKAKLLDIKVINGSVVMCRIMYKEKRIEFRDSYAILPASLERLTNDFNVEHKKLKMDYELGVNDKNFVQYFNNDLMGLYEVLEQSQSLLEKLTLAGNTMNIFIKKFYKEKISNNSLKLNELFRQGYYGGRVEIFKLRGVELNYYDINSLYPSVMHDFEYPLIENHNYEYTNEYIPDTLGYYYCNIKTPDMNIPILPYRREDKKLIFPVGSWSGWYYSPEIAKARELGYKIDVKRGYVFKKTDYIFKDFVEYYYNIKRHSSGSKKAIAKLLLNSLYGKFGQRTEFDEFIIGNGSERYFYIPFLNLTRTKRVSYAKYQHSEIAGLITSYARVRLYELFERAGIENIYYCDTDSIITSSLLKTSDALGDIKNESAISEFIAIAPKVYAYTSKDNGEVVIKAKGLNAKQLSFEDFRNAIYRNDFSKFVYEYERIATFKQYSVRHLNNFSDKLKVIRHLKSSYDKRIINVKDLSTMPFKV